MPLTPNERAIVKILYEYGRPMTVSQICKKSTDLTWRTVEACLNDLVDQDVVYWTTKNGKTYWHLNY